jgi:hypothetical protein
MGKNRLLNGAKATNPNYICQISCNGHGIDILADLPETTNLGVQSDWESPLPTTLAGLLDNVTGGAASAIASSIGANPQSQALSYQMWMGTTPLEIPLTLLFDANSSGLEDVYRPITALMQMVLPVNGAGGLLYPPGPKGGLTGAFGGREGYGVTVRIGRMMIFEDCIISAASETLDTKLDKDGFPISGEVECTFRTSLVYGTADFLNARSFGGGSSL